MVIHRGLSFTVVLMHLIFFVLPSAVFSQSSGVDISVSPREGDRDTTFDLTVTVDPNSVKSPPRLEDSDTFRVIASGTQSHTSIVNGSVSKHYSFRFSLSAVKTGVLKLPDVLIEQNGKAVRLSAGKVTVANTSASEQFKENGTVRFEQSVSSLTPFVGQQVLTQFRVSSLQPIRDIDFPAPNFAGFWVEDRERDQSGTVVENGERQHVFLTKRFLYPLQAGVTSIGEKKIQLHVLVPTNRRSRTLDPFSFGGFFATGDFQPVTLQSNPVEMNVRPLPERTSSQAFWAGAPLVGATKASLIGQAKTVDLGDSQTFTLRIETLGNVKPLKKIPFKETPGVKIYQEAPQTSFSQENGLLKMIHEISFSLVPNKGGNVTLSLPPLPYFNPETESYKRISFPGITFQVNGQAPLSLDEATVPTVATTPQPNSTTQQPEPIENKSIDENRFLKALSNTISVGSFLLLALIAAALVLLICFLQPHLKARRHKHAMLKRLNSCENASELATLFLSWIQGTFNLPVQSMRHADLASQLRTFIQDETLLLEIQKTLDTLEYAQFSAEQDIDLATLKQTIRTIIRDN